MSLLWQKNQNSTVLDPFFDFFSPKFTLAIKSKSRNLAQICPWHIGTCMQNFRHLAQSVWPWRYQISLGVLKCKILGPFFFNFKRFFVLLGWRTPLKVWEWVGTLGGNRFPKWASKISIFSLNQLFLKLRLKFWNSFFGFFGQKMRNNGNFFKIFHFLGKWG